MEAHSTARTGTSVERLAAAAGLTLARRLGRRKLDAARAEALGGNTTNSSPACSDPGLGCAAAHLGREAATWVG